MFNKKAKEPENRGMCLNFVVNCTVSPLLTDKELPSFFEETLIKAFAPGNFSANIERVTRTGEGVIENVSVNILFKK